MRRMWLCGILPAGFASGCELQAVYLLPAQHQWTETATFSGDFICKTDPEHLFSHALKHRFVCCLLRCKKRWKLVLRWVLFACLIALTQKNALTRKMVLHSLFFLRIYFSVLPFSQSLLFQQQISTRKACWKGPCRTHSRVWDLSEAGKKQVSVKIAQATTLRKVIKMWTLMYINMSLSIERILLFRNMTCTY